MGKLIKIQTNPHHSEKKLPEFLSNHVSVKTIKKVSMDQLHSQIKNDVSVPKRKISSHRKISSNEPPAVLESVFKVLQNPKLMTDILKKLDLIDLKSCRRVSHTWDDLTCHIMQTCRQIQISLVYSESRGIFIQPNSHMMTHDFPMEDALHKKKNLENLIKCVESSRNFPCKNFKFVSGNLGNEEIQQFFSLFGTEIKELHLHFGRTQKTIGQDEETLIEILRRLLLTQAPNIEHLNMSFISFSSSLKEPKNLFPESREGPVRLPNLKTLTIGLWLEEQSKLIRDILVAACKLKEFYHDEIVDTFLDMTMESNKICTVKKVSFSLINSSNLYMDHFTKFASTCPKLMQLDIGTRQRDWRILKAAASIVNKMFKSSQHTLNYLCLTPLEFISKFYTIKIPIFYELQTLVLRTFNSSTQTLTQPKLAEIERLKDEAIFPQKMQQKLAKVFPNVQSVVIDLVTDQDSFWDYHFPDLNDQEKMEEKLEFKSVKFLEIQRPCTPFWIRGLAKLFPNVEQLKLTVDSNCNSHEEIFLAWPRLERFAQRIVDDKFKIRNKL